MAEPKSYGCVAPFTDEELEKVRLGMPLHRIDLMGHDPKICYYCRFLATIAARDKRIEELEVNDKKNRVSIAGLIAEKLEQAAIIERLRGALEPFAKYAKSFNDFQSDEALFCTGVDQDTEIEDAHKLVVGDFRKARQALGKE